jgi:hypothetical protein
MHATHGSCMQLEDLVVTAALYFVERTIQERSHHDVQFFF